MLSVYGTESYKPNRNWKLTLTDLNTTYLEVDFISYSLISKRKQFEFCRDQLSIETSFNRTVVCKASPGLIYLHLGSNNQNVSFTFRTDDSLESIGFWISVKSKVVY